MTISKDLISSPIEAGPSLLDSQKLPLQMVEALDYVSSRLLRKHLHLTLIVVPDEATSSPLSPSQPSLPTPTASPVPSLSSRLRLPELPRSTSSLSSRSGSSLSSHSASSSSSATSKTATTSTSRKSKLGLPALDTSTPVESGSIALLHASSLSPKATRHLQTTIAKASKKYSLDENWLTTPTTPTAPGSPVSFSNPGSPVCSSVTNDLVRRSLQQNDLVFSSEGLTLLSLDRIYSFKLALSTYSRTLGATTTTSTPFSPLSPSPLSPSFTATSATTSSFPETQDQRRARQNAAKAQAVQALRLLTIAHSNRPISKSYLLRSYDHLPISTAALRAVNDAYRAAYQVDGIELPSATDAAAVVANPRLLRSKSGRQRSQGFFIERRDGVQGVDLGPWHRAPETPGGKEDVTPVTRGEWDELMWGKGLTGRGGVEMC